MTKHKFHNTPVETDGIKFQSKAESRYYQKLKMLQQSGEVVGFLRQTGFDVGGGVRYFADFQIFWSDGRVTFVDVKGLDTPISRTKRQIVESTHPWLKIEIVK